MKPENWTDYEHPCFDNHNPLPPMTKEEYIAQLEETEGIEDCDSCSGDCNWLLDGHDWHDCKSGRLSKWCNWLPKEAKNA